MPSTLALEVQQLESDMSKVTDPGLNTRLGELVERALGADYGTERYASVTRELHLLREDFERHLEKVLCLNAEAEVQQSAGTAYSGPSHVRA